MFTLIMAAVSLFGVGTILEKDRKENYEVKEMTKDEFFKEMGWE